MSLLLCQLRRKGVYGTGSQVKINAPMDKVWEVLADFGATDKWSPVISKSYSTTEANGGVGAGRHCQTSFGALKEQIVEWEEGRSFTIDGKTVLPMKFATVGALLDKLVLRREFRKALTQGLAGLKYHVETGEVVGTKLPEGGVKGPSVA